MTRLNVGVIGVGEMGRQHAENIRWKVPGARLMAIADVSIDRAKAVASDLGIESCYRSADELLEVPDLDAVIISSPPRFHASAIHAAAAAGKHIFCEKPLGLTVVEADQALDAVAKAGVTLQVGHMRRYDPPYVEAKKRIDAGEIGRVVLFKSIGRDQETPASAAAQTPLNGTILHDSSTHEFDLARWLMGDEVVEVHAYAGALAIPEMLDYGAFDSCVVNLRFAGGAIGNVESFMDAKYGYDIRTEIVGTRGTLMVGRMQRTAIAVLTSVGNTQDVVTHWLDRFGDAYRMELIDFTGNVLAGQPVRVTGFDGRQSLAIAAAALESVREERPAKVQSQHYSAAR